MLLQKNPKKSKSFFLYEAQVTKYNILAIVISTNKSSISTCDH